MNKEASKQLTPKPEGGCRGAREPFLKRRSTPATYLKFWTGPLPDAGSCTGPSRNRSLCDWTRTCCHGSGLSPPNGRGYQAEINRELRGYAGRASNHDSLREKVIEDLTRSDGLRLKPYRDSAGKLTIGVGRNLDDNGISEAEARLLLARDVDDAWRDLDDNCPWWGRMPEPARAALLNQCFDLGWSRLSKLKSMLAALKRGDYHAAADEVEDGKWFREVGDRARRVVELYRVAR